MNVKFLDKDHKEKYPIMGCYGIGVDRTIAAIIEQWNDKDGIIWPITVAPFEIIVIPVNIKEETVKKSAEQIYEKLNSRYEVLFEDRDLSPGFKFKDADLIGIPVKIIISSKNLKNNKIEIKLRRTQKSELIEISEIENKIEEIIQNEYKMYEV